LFYYDANIVFNYSRHKKSESDLTDHCCSMRCQTNLFSKYGSEHP